MSIRYIIMFNEMSYETFISYIYIELEAFENCSQTRLKHVFDEHLYFIFLYF